MTDREKVIDWLEKEIKSNDYWDNDYIDCIPVSILKNILALLKEHEAREPHYTTLRYLVNGTEIIVHHPECPRCIENGLALWDAEIEKGQAYCKRCGQAVKWE